MQTNTISRTLPELDEGVAAQTGNEILLDVASTEKVKRVPGASRSTVRAWTASGNVD
jgi:hypothetical protein